jgi:hypothetical protein
LAEDQDRYLVLLIPAAVVVECVAALQKVPRWLGWILRLLLAAGAAWAILHNTRYIADLAGPDTREWTRQETALRMGGMAVVLAVVWALLALLVRRAPGRSVPLALALACGGSAVAIMFSGYLSGGELGLPLAAALAGLAIASLALSPQPQLTAPMGVGVVGLFGLLLMGRFMGFLTTTHALLLFLALLLCWLPELPYVVKLAPWLRGVLRVVLVAVPVALVVLGAREQHEQDTAATSSGPGEVTAEDYINFGK